MILLKQITHKGPLRRRKCIYSQRAGNNLTMRIIRTIKHLIRQNHILAGRKPMRRTDILNQLVLKNRNSRYLEIGVRSGNNFQKVTAKHKDGVDPAGKCDYTMTSDEFFQFIKGTDRIYDLIFIDGFHGADQVLKDIENSLNHLDSNGTIVLHDCNPVKEVHQLKKPVTSTWNGTVWRAFAHLRMTRDDLSMCVVEADHGCGIIRRGIQKKFLLSPGEIINYAFLEVNREGLLNLIHQGHSGEAVFRGRY